MRILFLETYLGGSHKAFAEGWRNRSKHEVEIVGLPARKWKWRMQTGAAQLARALAERSDLETFDAIVASSLFSAAQFRGLVPEPLRTIPLILYFHENQYSYPVRAGNSEYEWGAIHLTSGLAADALVFNSEYNQRDFFAQLSRGIGKVPDLDGPEDWLAELRAKSSVLYPGVDLEAFAQEVPLPSRSPRTVLWNHRWEHDKRPDVFFRVLEDLSAEGIPFNLIVCGESFRFIPDCFYKAKEKLAKHIVHWGHAKKREDYIRLVRSSDIVISTSEQEFYGIAIIEALAAGCAALLPDRLNYPNLIPAERRKECLYSDETDLKSRLSSLLSQVAPPPSASPSDYLSRFDWESCAENLDKLVESITSV